jgi:BolA protein
MNRVEWIEQTLRQAFAPTHFSIEDDSAKHAGHTGARSGGGHFNVVIVADAFRGKSAVQRHQAVYAALGDAMKTEIHALAIKAMTPEEWRAEN